MLLEPFHELVLKFVEHTNRPIFLTGKAGTGKTTFLRYIKANITKNLAIVAPTAVAAINAGGVTIHSFFQVPFGPQLPDNGFALKQLSLEKAKLLKCLDLLIIDEISMVRADTLDYIDEVLRQAKGSVRPFGGVQLLMIGDLYQLPPVYEKDWPMLQRFYQGPYFFNSLVFKKTPVLTFELTQVYRQKDPEFLKILNHIRNGKVDADILAPLNVRYDANLNANWLQDYVTLSTHNKLVDEINQQRLAELDGIAQTFKATITGDFAKEGFPAEEALVLKVGAQVMFIKNDSSGKKQYYNGRTARITRLSESGIQLVFLDDQSEFVVVAETWNNVKYTLAEADQKVSSTNNGSFSQYPLRLAWAITIHKSQGLTFEKAVIDVDAAFAFGQAYVALSRCRTLEGMRLKAPVRAENIRTDPDILRFMQDAIASVPNEALLEQILSEQELEVLRDTFDFTVLATGWQQLKPMLAPSDLTQADVLLNKDIKEIGDRFIRVELAALPAGQAIWSNQEILIRLKKAASYFVPKLNSFAVAVNGFYAAKQGSVQTPAFYDQLNHLLVSLKAKIAGFVRLPLALSASDVISAVQEAGISFRPVYANYTGKALPTEKEIINPELYRELLNWRITISKERKVMEHTMLSDNTLRDISAKVPRSLKELSQLKSFGEAKATDFGGQVLKMIRTYLGENDLFG